MTLWQSFGYPPMVWASLAGLAAAALATGRGERARALWAAVRQRLADSRTTLLGGGFTHIARYRAALDAAFAAPDPAGSVEDAVARALRDD
jgi:hypothetical protein